MRRALCAALAWAALWPAAAGAHQPTLSALIVQVHPDRIDTLLDLDAVGIGEALRLDRDGNNVVDEAEFTQAQPAVMAYLEARFSVLGDGRPCQAQPVERYLVSGELDKLRVLRAWRCEPAPARLTLRNTILMDHEGGHTHVAQVQLGEQIHAHVLDPRQPEATVEVWSITGAPSPTAPLAAPAPAPPPSAWATFGEFLWQGVWHILIGLDHILFVVVLLVAVRRFKELALVVTSFTLAHSLTLALGALELVNPDPVIVESVIALSIVYVAIENLSTDQPRARYLVTFGFGLIHGFGFSGVLRDLGLPATHLAPALLAFNLGVELGQLALVAPLFPALAWLRARRPTWARRLTLAMSAPVLLIAVYWFFQRAFGA